MFRVSEKKLQEMCDKFGFFLKQINSSDSSYWRIMCTSPVFAPDTWPGLKNGGHTNSFCDLHGQNCEGCPYNYNEKEEHD